MRDRIRLITLIVSASALLSGRASTASRSTTPT
jgi:hypothetical protein